MPERINLTAIAMWCRQCLPLSVVQLKGKHSRNGVVDTSGHTRIRRTGRQKVNPKGNTYAAMTTYCPNICTTSLRQWGFRQCLPFSWTTLRGKHCRHPIAVMGVVDTFGRCMLKRILT